MSKKSKAEARKIYKHWKSKARNKFRNDKRQVTLSFDEWLKLKRTKNCYYCGIETKPTFDRLDSDIGYEKGNVVTACNTCNRMKGNIKVSDFIEKCGIIAKRFASPQKNIWEKIILFFERKFG